MLSYLAAKFIPQYEDLVTEKEEMKKGVKHTSMKRFLKKRKQHKRKQIRRLKRVLGRISWD